MADRLEPAARLPGEIELLAAVVASLAEDTAKLAYADFLDEHDDPRGAFLRRLVGAVREGHELPEPGDLSPGWLDLVGFYLEARIRECERTADRVAILGHARPAIAISTEPADERRFALGASKFGGRPDLPRGTGWPACDDTPLEFLAQFDLVELSRTLAGRALPPAGLLSFFMYHNYSEDAYGGPEYGRGVPGSLQIIYTPRAAELVRLEPPDDWPDDCGRPDRVCRPTFAEGLDLPDEWIPQHDDDYRWGRVATADHQLFGYSHITVLAVDPTPGPEWQQLLRFKSDGKLNWGWGDGHRLFWYTRTADLVAGRFDRTAAIDG